MKPGIGLTSGELFSDVSLKPRKRQYRVTVNQTTDTLPFLWLRDNSRGLNGALMKCQQAESGPSLHAAFGGKRMKLGQSECMHEVEQESLHTFLSFTTSPLGSS